MVSSRESAYREMMLGWCNTLRSSRDRQRRVATAILVAYLGLVIQPCAMAMGHASPQHAASCHELSVDGDHTLCSSQPAAECASAGWNVDGRNSPAPDFDFSVASIVLDRTADLSANRASPAHKLLCAPHSGEPALQIRHCVFLK
jgi:hypothetical protein